MGTQSNSSFDQSEDTFSSELDHPRTPANKKERKVFLIAQEIMTSERAYVDVLTLIYKNFRYNSYSYKSISSLTLGIQRGEGEMVGFKKQMVKGLIPGREGTLCCILH